MRLKSLTTGVAAATLIGAAAAGVTSIASAPTTPTVAFSPVVFGVPLPLQPQPTSGELEGVLNQLATPGTNKNALVDGGVGMIEGRTAERLLTNASQKGYLPLKISVSNVQDLGNGMVSATATASGPQLAQTSRPVTFHNDGTGWKLTKDSATGLLQAAMASG